MSFRWPILAFVLLVPLGQACSLSGPVPGPGVFLAWTPGDPGTTEILAEVDGRGLGAGCELDNPFDLQGDRFVYLENAYDYDRLVFIDADGRRATDLDVKGRARDVGLGTDYAYVVTEEFDGHFTRYLYLVRLSDLTVVPSPDPLADTRWQGGLEGSIAAWYGDRDGVWEVAAYDFTRMDWVLEPTDPSDVGLPREAAWMVAANQEWIVVQEEVAHGQYTIWGLYLPTKTVAQIEDVDAWMYALDGDILYGVDRETKKWDLFGGGRHTVAAPPVRFLEAVDAGRLVLGSYSVT